MFIIANIHLFHQRIFTRSHPRAPVILVPGIGGNQLKIKYDLPHVPYPFCSKKADWYTIWINFSEVFYTRCFAFHLMMIYNGSLNRMVDKPGTQVKGPEMGSLTEMEYLTESLKFLVKYYADTTEELTKYGYIKGIDLFGAGYDFRIIAVKETMEEYFQELTNLIESTFSSLNRRIVLVSHSLGGPIMSKFLSLKSQQWKDKYVELWYSINGVFAGSLNALLTVTEGYSLGFPEFFASPHLVKEMEGSHPSIYYLQPSVKYFNTSKVVFVTPKKNYTLGEINKVLKLTKVTNGELLYGQREEIWLDEFNLGVNFHCLYTTKVPTIDHIVVDSNLKIIKEASYNGNGDGTVLIDSLESCRKFSNEGYRSTYEVHENISHVEILRSNKMTESLMDMIRRL